MKKEKISISRKRYEDIIREVSFRADWYFDDDIMGDSFKREFIAGARYALKLLRSGH